MTRFFVKIIESCLWGLVVLALIGVNVGKLYCEGCAQSHVYVSMLPTAPACCCQGECRCPRCTPDKLPGEGNHLFYKIPVYSAVSENVLQADFTALLPASFLSTPVGWLEVKEKYYPVWKEYPDLPPSPEWLCIYRC